MRYLISRVHGSIVATVRMHPVLFLLLLLDVATKLLAYLLLPLNQSVGSPLTGLIFHLTLNDYSINTQFANLSENTSLAIALACSWCIEAGTIFALSKTAYSKRRKLGTGILSAVVLLIATVVFASIVHLRSIHTYGLSLFVFVADLLLLVSILRLFKSRYLQTAFAFIVAAVAGNTLSLLYPPFHVVDFLYSPIAHDALHLGIFNLSDLYYYPGFVMLAASPIVVLFRRVGNRNRQRETATLNKTSHDLET